MELTKEIAKAAQVLAKVAQEEGATSVRVTCFGNLKIHRSGERPEIFRPAEIGQAAGEDSND